MNIKEELKEIERETKRSLLRIKILAAMIFVVGWLSLAYLGDP